jgi:hypothetical protein
MWDSARRTENRHSDHVARITPRGASDERRAIRQCRECTQAAAFLLRCCFSQRIRTATNGSIAHEIECRTVQLLTLTTGRGRPSPKTRRDEDKALRGSSCKARAGVSSSGDRHRPSHASKRLHARGNASISGSAEHGSQNHLKGFPVHSENRFDRRPETNPVVTFLWRFGMFLNRITVNPETILSFHLDAAARANA